MAYLCENIMFYNRLKSKEYKSTSVNSNAEFTTAL